MGGSFFFMPRNQISAGELKVFVLNLKNDLRNESIYLSDPKLYVNKYLNKVLDKLEEYMY
jgi:hypothetical protein